MALLNEITTRCQNLKREKPKTVCLSAPHDFAGSEQNSVRSLNTERKKKLCTNFNTIVSSGMDFCAEIHSLKTNKREWSSSFSLSLSHFCVHFIGRRCQSVALQHHYNKQRDFLHTFYRQRGLSVVLHCKQASKQAVSI